MFPFDVVRTWLLGLLSLALLSYGAYLLGDYFELGEKIGLTDAVADPDDADAARPDGRRIDDRDEPWMLWTGLALLAFSLGGRWLLIPLLGPSEVTTPRATREGEVRRLRRPDGTELHVELHGPADGQPVVLAHGWSLNSTAWYYLKRELGDRYRLVLWDLPGLGLSSKAANNDYSIDRMASDLEAVIGEAGGKPVVLVGHSIGGMILQTFCRLYPGQVGSRVAGLVLVDTTYTNPLRTAMFSGLLTALQKPLIEPLLHLTVWTSPLVRLMSLQSYQNGTQHLTTRITSFAGGQTWGQVDFASRLAAFASPAVVARGSLAMLRFDESETLKDVRAATLVFAGRNDRLTKPIASERITAHVKGARLEAVEPGGHLAILERHAALAKAVGVFADECRQRRPEAVGA